MSQDLPADLPEPGDPLPALNSHPPAALRYWIATSWIGAGVLIVLAAIPTLLLWSWLGAWTLLGFIPVLAWSFVYGIFRPRLKLATHGWVLTDTLLAAQSGWLSRNRRIAPLNRVQSVDSRQGPLQRRFGLKDVVVTTASSAGAITIPALDVHTAEALEAAVSSRVSTVDVDGT